VNRSGSEEGLYGLKSRRIGLEWVSSSIMSNVSVCQREAWVWSMNVVRRDTGRVRAEKR